MTGLPVRTERLVHIYHTEGHDVAALSGVDLDVRGGEIVGCPSVTSTTCGPPGSR